MEGLLNFSGFVNESCQVSESLRYHLQNNLSVTQSIFRPGSPAHVELLAEVRQLFFKNQLYLSQLDAVLFAETDLGKVGWYSGKQVPLDLVFEDFEILESKYKGKKVQLNRPMRGGDVKKYYVYVRDPKNGRVKKISFGDVKGGLTAKVSNPAARKSFAARHNCAEKKDKLKAGYWACRINRYAHLWGGKTYPGFW